MIETRRLKNVVIFLQSILSFVLSRKIINIRFRTKEVIIYVLEKVLIFAYFSYNGGHQMAVAIAGKGK